MPLVSTYHVGSVTLTLNSATVTGVGTAFLANVNPGDFINSKLGQEAEILSVQSNTGLTLVNPWRAPTSTADAEYYIRFGSASDTVQASTRALLELLANGNLDAEAALVGAANKVAYYTGVGTKALTDFSVFGRTLVGKTTELQALDSLFGPLANTASAATVDLGAAGSNYLNITGTVPITSFGIATDGTVRFLRFNSAGLILTNTATISLPAAINITTTAADLAIFVFSGTIWRCLSYVPYDMINPVGAGTAAAPGIPFVSDPDTGIFSGGANIFGISAGGTERARFDVTNGLTLADGRITFPAIANLSTAANVLDDYEEGTFTPTVSGITTAGLGTYTSQTGRYTKIGNLVQFVLNMSWTAHTGTGTMAIDDLPFVATAGFLRPVTILSQNLLYANQLIGYMNGAVNRIIMTTNTTGGFSNVAMDINATVYVNGQYATLS